LALVGVVVWAVSVTAWVVMVRDRPQDQWFMGDLETYHDAVATLRHTDDAIYRGLFGHAKGQFIYPPFAALVFRSLLPLGMDGLRVFMAVAGHAALVAAAYAALGMLGYRRGMPRAGAALLVAAGGLWLEPVHKTLMFGQVSLVLMAAVLVDLALPDRCRWKGVGVGLAAGFKLTPGIFLVYLLLTRRFRAAAVACGTLVGTVAVGFAVLPGPARVYWFHAINASGDLNRHISFADGLNQSVRACVTRVLGETSAATGAWLLLAGVCALAGLAAAVLAAFRGQELLGVLLCAAVALLVSPISWSHHWVWAVPALVLMGDAATRLSRVVVRRVAWWGIGAYLAVMAVWPLRVDRHGSWDDGQPLRPFGVLWLTPHQDGLDFRWNAWQFVVGNSLLLVHAALFAVVVAVLLRGAVRAARPQLPVTAPGVESPLCAASSAESFAEASASAGSAEPRNTQVR
jgi:alpha-1,2-mannosyltransferase